MRIIFAGTPEFAVPTLQALINSSHEIIAVYTQPDKPSGRGQKLTPSPVKQLALANNLPVFQPKTLRDEIVQQQLRELNADVMVVAAYGLILPAVVLNIPCYGCINVHASLLPRWRGAAPIQRAIIAGDETTGITIMQMDEGLDTGGMYEKISCKIEAKETSETLTKKLASLGNDILLKTINALSKKEISAIAQDNTQACYAKKLEKAEAEINWQLSAVEIDRCVRGFNPWPTAFTVLNEQIIKVWETIPLDESTNKAPGQIIQANKQGIDVATKDGVLRLLKIQLPGGRCLSVADILNAKKDWFVPGAHLGK